MSSRRTTPLDMRTIKKSRSSFTGAVTKVKDKLLEMRAGEPQTFNVRALERLLASISHSETGFQQTVEDVEELLEDEESAPTVDQEEEKSVISEFQDHVELTMDMAQDMLATKKICMDTAALKKHIQALRDTFLEDPSLSQDDALSDLTAAFSAIQADLKNTTLDTSHPLWREVDSFYPIVNRLRADLETGL